MDELMSKLSEDDRKIVLECLSAALNSEFYPDWEFETLFGIGRDAVKSVHDSWPKVDLSNEDTGAVVIGSLNNLLGYPHGMQSKWDECFSVPPEDVKKTLDRLLEIGV